MRKGEDGMGIIQSAQQLQRDRTASALRVTASAIVAGKIVTPEQLLERADAERIDLDALGQALEHEREARRMVVTARRVADRGPNELRSAVFPLTPLMPASTRRAIEDADHAAGKASARAAKAREHARLHAVTGSSVRRHLAEVASTSPAPVAILPGVLMMNNAPSQFQHDHAAKQLADWDEITADAERAAELEAESERLAAHAGELRAAAFDALVLEYGAGS